MERTPTLGKPNITPYFDVTLIYLFILGDLQMIVGYSCNRCADPVENSCVALCAMRSAVSFPLPCVKSVAVTSKRSNRNNCSRHLILVFYQLSNGRRVNISFDSMGNRADFNLFDLFKLKKVLPEFFHILLNIRGIFNSIICCI